MHMFRHPGDTCVQEEKGHLNVCVCVVCVWCVSQENKGKQRLIARTAWEGLRPAPRCLLQAKKTRNEQREMRKTKSATICGGFERNAEEQKKKARARIHHFGTEGKRKEGTQKQTRGRFVMFVIRSEIRERRVDRC